MWGRGVEKVIFFSQRLQHSFKKNLFFFFFFGGGGGGRGGGGEGVWRLG